MKKGFLFFALFAAILLLASCPMEVDNNTGGEDNKEQPIDWIDSTFEKAVKKTLGKEEGETITQSEASAVTKLNLYNQEISDISDIINFPALTELILKRNSLSNDALNNLSTLTNLTFLDLSNTSISDISALGVLTNLTELDISRNEITFITELAKLTKLVTLKLEFNEITDISALANLENLLEVDLSYNDGDIDDWSPVNNVLTVHGRPNYAELDTTEPTLLADGTTYEIYLPSDLAWLAAQGEGVNFAGKTFRFMNDIDMTGLEFGGIPRFAGIMDGNDKKITNLRIIREDITYVGLVRYLEGGEIKNLTIESGYIAGRDSVGAFVGVARGGNSSGTTTSPKLSGLINKVTVLGKMVVGGIIGASDILSGSNAKILITDVENTGPVMGIGTTELLGANIGGIIGKTSYAEITNATNSGKISGDTNIGGIVGWADEMVTLATPINSGLVESDVEETLVIAGGIIGTASYGVTITNGQNTGNVTIGGISNNDRMAIGGGIIGRANGTDVGITIENTNNSGAVEVKGKSLQPEGFTFPVRVTAGGIIGQALEEIRITGTTNTGDILSGIGAAIAGGIIGHSLVLESAVLIQDVENTGSVYAWGPPNTLDDITYVSPSGGIVGLAEVLQTTSTKTIEIKILDAKNVPTNTENTIHVYGDNGISGGIVGQGLLTYFTGNTSQGILIEKAENRGTIEGNAQYLYPTIVGGIIGQMIAIEVSPQAPSNLNAQSFSLMTENRSLTTSTRNLNMSTRSTTGKKILVNKVMNFGDVTADGKGNVVGGIVGHTNGNVATTIGVIGITNAGNVGKINAQVNSSKDGIAGGIIGVNNIATMDKTYNYGELYESNARGSLIGILTQDVTIENSYFLEHTDYLAILVTEGLTPSKAKITKLTTDNFKILSNFIGFDATIWQMDTYYPILR